jgi:ABC-type nitrate/sulfonate/bicarbonate transport system substrate-binding protein
MIRLENGRFEPAPRGKVYPSWLRFLVAERDRRVALLPLLTIAVMLTLATGCGRSGEEAEPAELEEISLATTSWPASLPAYVAAKERYFEDEHLAVTLQPCLSGHLGLAQMVSGQADFALSGETPITLAVMEGDSLAIVATVCEIDRAILIIARRDRGISERGDLRGKRIGVVRGTTADFFLSIFLSTSFIDPEDVSIVNLPEGGVVDALMKDQVDAVSTWTPHTLILQEMLGDNALVLTDPGIYTMTWDLVTTRGFVGENPRVVRRLLRAMARAVEFIREHPSESHAMVADYMGETSPMPDSDWPNYRFLLELDQSLILNLEDQARWVNKNEGAGEHSLPDFLDFVFPEGLRSMNPDMVRITGK